MSMSEQAKKAKSEYMKAWRKKNREKVNQWQREFRKNHPERWQAYQDKYWAKKAQEMETDE